MKLLTFLTLFLLPLFSSQSISDADDKLEFDTSLHLTNSALEKIPLASISPFTIDQSIFLYKAPLPKACQSNKETVTLCSSPLQLTLPATRYEYLKANWGERSQTTPSRINVFMQTDPSSWDLLLKPSSLQPLVWWDPNHDGWLRLWPVLPDVAQLISHDKTPLPQILYDGPDTARINLSQYIGHLRKWSVYWEKPYLLKIAWSATRPPRRILIDPGHGGTEIGTANGIVKEKDLNLKAAVKLQQAIIKLGGSASLTRSEDKDLSLPDRFKRIESEDVDLAVSLHHDWVSPEIFSVRPACFFSRYDVQSLARELCSALEMSGSGKVAISRRNLLITLPRKVPVVLLELLNFKSEKEQRILNNPILYENFLSSWAKKTALVLLNEALSK